MNALKKHLMNLCQGQGPLSIVEFMTEALCHPKFGYYMKQDPFGADGDFTTAPEISQMFGEMMGIWLADCWISSGSPEKFFIAEMGPGRGTLMVDALRAISSVEGMLKGAEIHLVEISPTLREIQKEKLSNYHIHFHNDIHSLLSCAKETPLFMVMNELFDALPIRQFQKSASGWHERMVGLNEDETDLQIVLMPDMISPALVPTVIREADVDSIFEYCPIGDALMENIAHHIKSFGGAAVIIDYGYDRPATGDTLQAMKDHKYCDILSHIGDADLTAHVNFKNLQNIANNTGAFTTDIASQGAFLHRLGIIPRAEKLLETATAKQAEDIMSALNRLLSDDEMGTLFKVMAVHSGSHQNIAGF